MFSAMNSVQTLKGPGNESKYNSREDSTESAYELVVDSRENLVSQNAGVVSANRY